MSEIFYVAVHADGQEIRMGRHSDGYVWIQSDYTVRYTIAEARAILHGLQVILRNEEH